MEKINFMTIFIGMLISMAFSQKTQNDLPLNKPRKLMEYTNETILLGFDNYTAHIPDGYKNYTLSFFTYFLFKNWYPYYIDDKYLNNFTITTRINDTNKNRFYTNFICVYDKYRDLRENNEITKYYIVRYSCDSELIERGIPKLMNFTTDFENDININNSAVYKVSPSFEVFKKDLSTLELKNVEMFNLDDDYDHYQYRDIPNFHVLTNSTVLNKNQASFKIKGGLDQRYPTESNNIQLFVNSYGVPKKIPCEGKWERDKTDDEEYYFLQSKGSNNLRNAELQYAIGNITTKEEIFILDFAEDQNSTILPDKVDFKKGSGGLSTGGIIAIVIPAVAVLLGVGALAFFLSRRAVPSPPPMKNIANNTMGVVASSEAVVHQ